MKIYRFEEHRPAIDPSAFVHPDAVVIGNVSIGRNAYIGPCAVLRGDFGRIVVGEGSNVQENCTIHMFPGTVAEIGRGVTIGHGAVIHGARIGDEALIGMNAVIMDNAEIGERCIVGALTLVPAGMRIPAGKVAVGSPARVVKEVDEAMESWKRAGSAFYQELCGRMQATLAPCDPDTDE